MANNNENDDDDDNDDDSNKEHVSLQSWGNQSINAEHQVTDDVQTKSTVSGKPSCEFNL